MHRYHIKNTAFNLIKQDEKIDEANKTWWGLIKTIKN